MRHVRLGPPAPILALLGTSLRSGQPAPESECRLSPWPVHKPDRRKTTHCGHWATFNPARTGTKAAAHYALDVAGGGSRTVRLRLAAARTDHPFDGFEQVFDSRIADIASRPRFSQV